jgi:hypothetical protein
LKFFAQPTANIFCVYTNQNQLTAVKNVFPEFYSNICPRFMENHVENIINNFGSFYTGKKTFKKTTILENNKFDVQKMRLFKEQNYGLLMT